MKVFLIEKNKTQELGKIQGKGYHVRKGDLIHINNTFYEVDRKIWEPDGEVSSIIVNDNFRFIQNSENNR